MHDPCCNSGRIEAAPDGGGTPIQGLTQHDRLYRPEGYMQPTFSRLDPARTAVV